MTMYLTPEKYRTMGFGIDLDDIENVELASIMARASAIADGYCAVPRLPRPYSFLGGVITPESPEQHVWRLPENDFDVGSRRVYPYSWPIKSVTEVNIRVTNTQYVHVETPQLFINNTERYVEIVSLLLTGVGIFGMILPSLGLMKPVAEIAYTYGYEFDEFGEILYPTDARTYRALNQFWLPSPEEPKVYVNGTIQTTGYTVDRTEGAVVFNAQQAAGSVITLDYKFSLPHEIRDAVGMIATHLLGERESQARGMTGVKRLKIAEVSIEKAGKNVDKKLSSESLAYIVPEAAWLLDGFKFWTVR